MQSTMLPTMFLRQISLMVNESNFTFQSFCIWFIITSLIRMITLCPPPKHVTKSKIAMYCPQQCCTHLEMLFIISIVSFCTFFPQLFQLINQWFQVNINLISWLIRTRNNIKYSSFITNQGGRL